MGDDLKQYVDAVPDFPEKGILFRDISPLLRDKHNEAIDAMSALFSSDEWDNIDVIAGVDARGFIFASSLAYKHNKGFVAVRKAGKLPNVAVQVQYGLEYGEDALEMQSGGGNVLLIDDVLATGGTLEAAANLCKQTGHNIVGIAAFVNLKDLNNFQWEGLTVRSVLEY